MFFLFVLTKYNDEKIFQWYLLRGLYDGVLFVTLCAQWQVKSQSDIWYHATEHIDGVERVRSRG